VTGRLLSLGALLLFTTGCGAEAVPSEEGSGADTARIETVTRVSGSGGTHEVRSGSVVDYARDRSSYVEPTSGCRGITIGDVSYVEVPQQAGLPPGKRWVKSDWDTADAEAEFEASQKPQTDADGAWTSYGFMLAFSEPPPGDYLGYLREHGELERVGEENVRGVPTTHYRTTLDRKQLTREQLEREGWKDANIEKHLQTIPETEEEVELWVDAADLTRRVVTTSTTTFAQVGMTHRSVTTTEYFDFGVELAIEPPPAGEVIESEEWQRMQEQQLEELQIEGEVGTGLLPGAFEPNVTPSCLH
jgi:hypothetical protein